ncbi:hypothetical protein [Rhodomicrobium sp.]|uniref:hypothetical protein n=1 Tax=Rhodomicrobium sp. TaxID=2720632 RepID=UPI0039E5B188
MIFFVLLLTVTGNGMIPFAKENDAACEVGTPTSGRFFIEHRETPFFIYPDKNKGKVINVTASRALRTTHYRDLWPTMVLSGLCETPDWLQAKIIEADGSPVDWEIGWVEKSGLRMNASSEYKAGLLWDIDGEYDFTTQEKIFLRDAALMVLKRYPNCIRITSGYRSGDKIGQYYVTCTAKNGLPPFFNIWFSEEDVKTGKGFSASYPSN